MESYSICIYILLLFNYSVMSDSLQPAGLQQARFPRPSPSPEACSNSCPLNQWCHPTILSSVIPFSSYPQYFQASGSILMSWIFLSGGQSIGAAVCPMNIQKWFPLGWLVWSPCCPKDSQESSPTPWFKSSNSSVLSLLYSPTLTWLLEKTIGFRWTFVSKLASLLFNMLSRFVIAFLPRSKHLLTSWLQSPTAVILEPRKIKSVTVSIVSPSICHEVMGLDAMILVFWMLCFKPAFSLSSFTFIERLFSSSSLSAIRVVSSTYLRLLIFLLTILILACASYIYKCTYISKCVHVIYMYMCVHI